MGVVRTGQFKGKIEKFVPGSSYKWEPTDIFEINGQEFNFLLDIVREAAVKPGGTSAVSLVNIHNFFETLLISGVEQGVVVEKVAESTDPIEGVSLPS